MENSNYHLKTVITKTLINHLNKATNLSSNKKLYNLCNDPANLDRVVYLEITELNKPSSTCDRYTITSGKGEVKLFVKNADGLPTTKVFSFNFEDILVDPSNDIITDKDFEVSFYG